MIQPVCLIVARNREEMAVYMRDRDPAGFQMAEEPAVLHRPAEGIRNGKERALAPVLLHIPIEDVLVGSAVSGAVCAVCACPFREFDRVELGAVQPVDRIAEGKHPASRCVHVVLRAGDTVHNDRFPVRVILIVEPALCGRCRMHACRAHEPCGGQRTQPSGSMLHFVSPCGSFFLYITIFYQICQCLLKRIRSGGK